MTWWRQMAVTVAVLGSLAGCANSDLGRTRMLSSGELTVDPSERPGYDYRVGLMNSFDVGYEPDDLPQRQAQARGILARQCKALEFGPEDVLALGVTPLGRERRRYLMHVRCLN